MEDILDLGSNEETDPLAGPSLESLRQTGYEFNMSRFFERGWAAMNDHIWLYILYTVLFVIISMVASFTYIGQYLVSGPLAAGFFTFGALALRKQNPDFGRFFDGFKDFVPLLVFTLLQLAIGLVMLLPFGLWFGFNFELFIDPPTDPEYAQQLILQLLPLYGIMAILMTLVYSMMMFAYPLIVIGRLGAIDAIKWSFRITYKKLGWFILYTFIIGLIAGVGVLACGVGALFTVPLAQCYLLGAYAEIVGLGDKSKMLV